METATKRIYFTDRTALTFAATTAAAVASRPGEPDRAGIALARLARRA